MICIWRLKHARKLYAGSNSCLTGTAGCCVFLTVKLNSSKMTCHHGHLFVKLVGQQEMLRSDFSNLIRPSFWLAEKDTKPKHTAGQGRGVSAVKTPPSVHPANCAAGVAYKLNECFVLKLPFVRHFLMKLNSADNIKSWLAAVRHSLDSHVAIYSSAS